MKEDVKKIIEGHWNAFEKSISMIELWHDAAQALGEAVYEDSLLAVLNKLLSDGEIEESAPNYFRPKQK